MPFMLAMSSAAQARSPVKDLLRMIFKGSVRKQVEAPRLTYRQRLLHAGFQGRTPLLSGLIDWRNPSSAAAHNTINTAP